MDQRKDAIANHSSKHGAAGAQVRAAIALTPSILTPRGANSIASKQTRPRQADLAAAQP
jgi:hypothetical protein